MTRILLLATLLLGTGAYANAATTMTGTTPCTCVVGDIQIDQNGTDGCTRRRECKRYDDEGKALCTLEFIIEDKDGVTTIRVLRGIWSQWTEVCDKEDEKSLVEQLVR